MRKNAGKRRYEARQRTVPKKEHVLRLVEDARKRIKIQIEAIKEFAEPELRHDLAGVLTPAIGGIEYANYFVEKNPKECRNHAERAIIRLDFVEEILKSFKRKFALQQVPFSNFVKSIETLCKMELEGSGITYIVKSKLNRDNQKAQIFIDHTALKRAVYNLVTNAARSAAPRSASPKGKVIININLEKEVLQIAVSDNGMGMKQEKINDFYKGEKIPSRGALHGFGLLNVKEIVKRHKGKVLIQSNQGQGNCYKSTKGTTVTIEIPISKK